MEAPSPPPPALVVRFPLAPKVDPDPRTGAMDMEQRSPLPKRLVKVFVRGVFPARAYAFEYIIDRYVTRQGIIYPTFIGMRGIPYSPRIGEHILTLDKDTQRQETTYFTHGAEMRLLWQVSGGTTWDEAWRIPLTALEAVVLEHVRAHTIARGTLVCSGGMLATLPVPTDEVSEDDILASVESLVRKEALVIHGENGLGLAREYDDAQAFLTLVSELNARPVPGNPPNMSFVMYFESHDTIPDLRHYKFEFDEVFHAERVPVNADLINYLTAAPRPVFFFGNPLLRRPSVMDVTMLDWPASALYRGDIKRRPATPRHVRVEFVRDMTPRGTDVVLTSNPLSRAPNARFVRTIEDDEEFGAVWFQASKDTTREDLARAQACARSTLVIADMDRTAITEAASYL